MAAANGGAGNHRCMGYPPGVGIRLDHSQWPLIVTTTPRKVSAEEMHAFLEEYERVIAGHEGPYVDVLDLRDNEGLTPKMRQQLTDSVEAIEGRTGRRCKGSAMVFSETEK